MAALRGIVASLLLVGLLAAAARLEEPSPAVIIGVPDGATTTPLPGPTIPIPPSSRHRVARPDIGRPPIPEPRGGRGLKIANGRPFRPAIPFISSIDVPDQLTFILVVGSDARPRENVRRAHADSIHVLAVNPATMEGTVVGIPRDAWVEIPGHGRNKITMALAMGGPQLMADTVRRLTGLPIHYYALTGFQGLMSLVDEIGGVDVFVERRMNDRYSGARFQPGWHHFNGGEALAYSRDRHDVEYGDFTRSEHQGALMLATLGKMRSEVGDDDGIAAWVRVLVRHVELDMPLSDVPRFAALVRRLDLERVDNVVAPGRVGSAGRASVVYLTEDARRLFVDLRDDGVIGDPTPPPSTTTTTTTTTTREPPSSTTTTIRPGTTSTTRPTTTTTSRPPGPGPRATTTTTAR